MADRMVRRIEILANPLFWISVLLFGVNYGLESQGIFIPYVHQWMDDVLCLPVVLTLTTVLMNILLPMPGWRAGWRETLAAVLFFGLFFELILPRVSSLYTADLIDVFAYALGGGLFLTFQGKQGENDEASAKS